LDLEVGLQQFDHWEIWGATPIRDRRGFQEHTPVGKAFELIKEPRLSESWLTCNTNNLSLSCFCTRQGGLKLIKFIVPPDKARQPTSGGDMQPCAQ
jgi:hypothetical protein